MRERLIELIENALNIRLAMGLCCTLDEVIDLPSREEIIADHLLANGVIVPPMKLGQTCYKPVNYRNDVDECRVSSITQKADGTFKIRLTNLRGKRVFEITTDEIGKTVFLSKEEAEKALKGGEG